MINGTLAIVCLLFAVFALGGCGISSESGKSENSRPNEPVLASENVPAPGSSPANGHNNSAEDVNAGPESSTGSVRNKKLDAIRKAGNDTGGQQLDVESILKQSTRPAPENSEFAVALTTFLLERRTFRNHPLLARVEKLTEGEKTSIRVQTTDGKVHKLPGDAIPALSTVPSRTILGLLGIEAPAQRSSDTKAKAPMKN